MAFSNRDYGEWEILDGPYPVDPTDPPPLIPAGAPRYTPYQHLWLAHHHVPTAQITVRSAVAPEDGDVLELARRLCSSEDDAVTFAAVVTSALTASTRLCRSMDDAAYIFRIETIHAALNTANVRMGEEAYSLAERLGRNIAADYGETSAYALVAQWFEFAIVGALGASRLSEITCAHLLQPWYDAMEESQSEVPFAA